MAKKGSKRAQNGEKWSEKRVEAPLGPSGLTNFDSPPNFTPTLGGRGHWLAIAPAQMAKKGVEKAPQLPQWPKMAYKVGLDATWALGTPEI